MSKIAIPALAAAGLAGPMLERKDANGDSAGDTDTETKAALDGLIRANEEFKATVLAEVKEIREKGATDPTTTAKLENLGKDLDGIKAKVDAIRLKDRRPETIGADGRKREMTEFEAKHRDAMLGYLRKGDEAGYGALVDMPEMKALTAGSDPDGGFTIIPELDRNISRIVSEVSPIRSVANVVSVGTSGFKRLVNVGGTGSGWVGESSSRPQTDPSSLRERTYTAMELYAMPAASQTVLDDSSFDLEAWIADEVQITFAEQEGAAFITGDGVSKPRGFIGGYTPVADASFTEAGGAPGYVASGAASTLLTTADGDEFTNLIDLIQALKASYRANARFVVNRATVGVLRKLRDTNGQFYWQQSVQAGQPSTLLGYPVLEAEDMPDIAANAFPIAFGDFNRGYQIVDRMGTRILRDPYTAKPFVQFYTTKRVGGGIRMAEAIKLLKIATS